MMQPLDRRSFTVLGATAAGACLIPRGALAQQASDPHFFLQIVLPGGLDPTYTFDARPLSFVAAQKHANYDTAERIRRVGANGGECWSTGLVKALDPFKDRFSVVNGVVMLPLFDGHENNTSFMMTGDAFSGNSQLPDLNLAPAAPLDYVRMGGGSLLAQLNNAGNSVPLSPRAAKSFSERLAKLPPLTGKTPLKTFLKDRMVLAGRGKGSFSAAARAIDQALDRMPDLAEALRTIEVEPAADAQDDDVAGAAKLIGELFKRGVTRSALFVFNTDLSPKQNLDTHGGDDAKKLPTLIPKLMDDLATMLGHLAATPFDDQRSLLDVTTFTVATEFARTLRQTFLDFDKSGTDHNPLTNTVLIGGKGVRGGLVVGASDLQALDEAPSPAHKSQDKELVKMMGRPFDFAAGKPAEALPEVYREEDYISYSSVANSVYKIFGVGTDKYRLTRRNGPVAPAIDQLLS
jgi:hypothetical protein